MTKLKLLMFLAVVVLANVSYEDGRFESSQTVYAQCGPLNPCPACTCGTTVSGIAEGEWFEYQYWESGGAHTSESACISSCGVIAHDRAAAVCSLPNLEWHQYGYTVAYGPYSVYLSPTEPVSCD